MQDTVKQLVAELIAADPSLKGRDAVLTELVGDLLAARPDASMDAGFRARLRAQLAARMPRPKARLASPYGMRLYYGLGAVAVLLLLVLVLPDEPQQVALKSESGSPPAAELAMDAASGAREAAPMAFTQMTAFTLTSSAFEDGGMIPAQYTCDGENSPPPLQISGIPEGTMSLALIMHDPVVDSVHDDDVTHWVAYNGDPSSSDFTRAVQGVNEAGAVGYLGPCPSDGLHLYLFSVYALDAVLDLPEGATTMEVGEAMEGHKLGSTVLFGAYQRK